MTFYNFAYGSNMSLSRIRARLPNVIRIGVMSAPGYKLTFDKSGLDDSGKCNAIYTGNNYDLLYGVLYQLTAQEKAILDDIEGPRYDNHALTLTDDDKNQYSAYCYSANTTDSNLLPFDWYLQHVLTGATEAQLPQAYIQNITQQATCQDNDLARYERETAIYKKRTNKLTLSNK